MDLRQGLTVDVRGAEIVHACHYWRTRADRHAALWYDARAWTGKPCPLAEAAPLTVWCNVVCDAGRLNLTTTNRKRDARTSAEKHAAALVLESLCWAKLHVIAKPVLHNVILYTF